MSRAAAPMEKQARRVCDCFTVSLFSLLVFLSIVGKIRKMPMYICYMKAVKSIVCVLF